MSEEKAVRTKPSARQFVSITVSEYKPGMENDARFAGVMFRANVPVDLQVDTPEAMVSRNALRNGLGADICQAFGVKPLGAASAPSGGVKTLENYIRDIIADRADTLGKTEKQVAQACLDPKNTSTLENFQKAFKKRKNRDATVDQIKEVLSKLV